MLEHRLAEVFPTWLNGGGIITAITNITGYSPPWSATAQNIDTEYYGNHSGEKYTSPLVNKLVNSDTGILSDSAIDTLAYIIKDMYSQKWTKEWATLTFTYNPIENYNSTETETIVGANEGTQVNTDITDYGQTDTRTLNTNTRETSDIYGYNSATESPADKSNTENTGTDTTAKSGRDTTNNTRVDNLTNRENRTLNRNGNIGVTTSQQMIQAERELYFWDFYKDVLFKDLDKILTINIY